MQGRTCSGRKGVTQCLGTREEARQRSREGQTTQYLVMLHSITQKQIIGDKWHVCWGSGRRAGLGAARGKLGQPEKAKTGEGGWVDGQMGWMTACDGCTALWMCKSAK